MAGSRTFRIAGILGISLFVCRATHG
jgi:hypothetical protein